MARRAGASAERAMCREAMRSDALGRLARGDSTEQVLGVLTATLHISNPGLKCSICLGDESNPEALQSPSAWPVMGSNGRHLASVLVNRTPEQLRRHQMDLIDSVAKLAAVVIEHKALHREWEYAATHDWLTGMANRRVFSEKVNLFNQRPSPDRSATVFFVDLDRFKQINDIYGHDIGDLFLREAAARIRSCVPASDLVARMGGDEFTVIAENLTANDATRICERIIEQFRLPFLIGNLRLFGSASIGVSTWPRDGDNAAEIQRNADCALYDAKELGRNQFRIYTAAMRQREATRMQMEQLIRQALDSSLLELFYQPQVNEKGRLVGLEALVRMRHPERGLIMPEHFIGVAQDGGLITRIDLWVLAEACRQHSLWRREGHQPVRIAVNMSRASLAEPDLDVKICDILNRAGVEPSSIQIEITEAASLQDGEATHETLRRLRKAGISLALDDFGTGYSSLSCLHSLPVDTVKIDKSFAHHLREDANLFPFVQAIIGVARTLRLSIVAEGIETAEQMASMRSLGCDVLQGFYICPPVPAAEISRGAIFKSEDTSSILHRLSEALTDKPSGGSGRQPTALLYRQ
jgi:diguanylate cyclase (GGDEF)-like protein